MIEGFRSEVRDGMKHHSEKLVSIEAKQDHTNGRVRKLEAWKYVMLGGVGVVNLIFVPLIVWFLQFLLERQLNH